ncbi:IFA38 (YBR159W) [Zygosaccharomyces parabailii]|nr:IFA38 (YBR159W) [Zygosaccharomyces parabailii]CDH08839.1 probable 3-ketoacyl-CoA reductase [Zygosaccharomyces bailii ISA1307]
MSFLQELNAVAQRSKCVNYLLWGAFGFGIIKLTTLFLRVLALVFDLFILTPTNYAKYGAGKGFYCVVTGASDGIGKEFARQMAKRKFNLILVSRTLSKLEALQKDLTKDYGVDVKVLAFDASEDSSVNYVELQNICEKLPVTVLINNVGQSHSIPVPFLETEEKELRNIITINNTATVMITQSVAPTIVKNAATTGQRGLILTMGSFGGLIPTPLLATYSGSKSFLQGWSSALAGELKEKNVDVELILSYLVTSAMSKVKRSSAMIPNPKCFVRSTLSSVGRRCGAQERFATMTPFWSHALYHFVIEETLGVYSKSVNSINYCFHKSIRQRALRKAERMSKSQ